MRLGEVFSRHRGYASAALLFVVVVCFAGVPAGPARSAQETHSVEAETMRPGKGKVFTDRSASRDRAVLLRSNTTASGRVSLPASSALVVRAKGNRCAGLPRMNVRVDGRTVASRKVGPGKWTGYRVETGIPAGTRAVSVSFVNDYRRKGRCDRSLSLDRIDFIPMDVSQPPPADPPAQPPVVEPPSGFVGVDGTGFTLDGAPFRMVGTNMTNTAGNPEVHECGPWVFESGAAGDAQVESWFRRAREDFGGNTLRIWLYQGFTDGGTDWRGFDRTVRLARKYDYKIVPVLENQWTECSEGGYKYDSWYASGYKQPYGKYEISYREYVSRVVSRYRDDPTVAAWMLMNEAESKTPAGDPNPQPLYDFTKDMSALVKSLDPNHLVTLGTIGADQPGASGTSWERIHALPTVDFTEFHDYARNDEPMPGAPLEPEVDLGTSVFTHDQDWVWTDSEERRNKARAWETFTYTVPEGARPFRRVGLNLRGDFSGDVYIDDVKVGGRSYGFEDGTRQGFDSSPPVALSNAGNIRHSGSRSLKLSVSRAKDAQVWVEVGPEVGPGAEVSFRVYVDDPGSIEHSRTLAAAMSRSEKLGKPIIVGEAGMTTCRSFDGSQVETQASRASKMDAKMGAFFRAGGAGYLTWVWHPDSGCGHEFTTGDPLNDVIRGYSR